MRKKKNSAQEDAQKLYDQRIRKPKVNKDMQMNVFERVFGAPFRALERSKIKRARRS